MGYFASRHFQKIRNFSLSQQALIVAILILLKRTIVFQNLVEGIVERL
jgi:rod shape-determining protein MreD